MAHLCSRYLEKKLIKFQKSDMRNGYHSEDEVYGFLPTPFKRKKKRELLGEKRATSQTRARKELFASHKKSLNTPSKDDQSKTKRPAAGLRDVTNNYNDSKTTTSKTPRNTQKDRTFENKSRTSGKNAVSGLLLSDKMMTIKSGKYFRLNESNLNESQASISSRCSVTSDSQSQTESSCQSLIDSCQSSNSAKYRPSPIGGNRPISTTDWSKRRCQSQQRDTVAMVKTRYPRTIQEVEACLLRSSLVQPANIVMFVVKRHFLKNESGEITSQKTCIGMLVNAIFSSQTGDTFVRLPNGHAGFVPKDILKPVGVKNARDFTQQFPENSTLATAPFCDDVTPSIGRCIRQIFDISAPNKSVNESANTTQSLDTSFSEGSFTNSTCNSNFDDPEIGLITPCSEPTQSNNAFISGTTNDFCDEAASSSTDRQSLLDYLKLLENNSHQVQTVDNRLLKNDAELVITSSEEGLSGSQLINSCVTAVQNEANINTSPSTSANAIDVSNNSAISTETNEDGYGSLEMDSQYSTEKDIKNTGDISRISLCDITFRPALNKHAMEKNTYQNLPDLSLLMKRCSIKNKLDSKVSEYCKSNDSGISQTSSISAELYGEETGQRNVNNSLKAELSGGETSHEFNSLKANHGRTDSGQTSLIARCGSYGELCRSPDCAMCCPCKSCGFERGSSHTLSSSTPCIENLSSIHAASTTVTSELTLVTSPESMTSAVTSYTSKASMKYNCCSFFDTRTPGSGSTGNQSVGKHRRKSPHKSPTCEKESLNKSVDLLKTIESIETTDSGNWSEMSSDDEEMIEETRQPRLTALFDYVKKSVYDVNLRKQEVVTLINEQNPDWLWVKTEKGETGYIPRNFVVNLEKLNLDPHTKTTYL